MITLLTVLGWMAWAGGIALFIQLILLMFGHHGDFTSTDIHTDIGNSGDLGDTGHDSDSNSGDSGMKLFSILGITTFFFMFGLAARYCMLSLSFHWGTALLIALVIGIAMMYIIGWIFYKAKSLESDGTTRIKDTIDCIGTVYLPFSGDIIGTVHINVNGILREYDAMAEDITANFNVGNSVKVVSIQGNFVRVTKNN